MRFLLIAAVLLVASPATAAHVAWAVETWECGTQIFQIQVGDGRDIAVKSFTGEVAAAALPGSKGDSKTVRQSMLSVLASAFYGKPSQAGRITETPDIPRVNHAVDDHLFAINMKQMGMSTPQIPVSYSFDPPVIIPEGRLMAHVVTESYAAGPPSFLIKDNPVECLNTEMHVTIVFDEPVASR